MKLRTYLLLANIISIAFIMVLLLVFFHYMLVTRQQLIWLTSATLVAGVVSAGLHFLFIRPLEGSVRRLGEGAGRIAGGNLEARVPLDGFKEFKQLAEQFNQMGSSLAKSFREVRAAESAKRELVANMAHDLRTPLTSVQSYVEALEDGVIEDEETFRRYLATIRSETVRLGELMQDLFELATLDAATKSTKKLAFAELEDVLVELLPRFINPLEEKELDLQVVLPEQPIGLLMLPQHLQRILQNLLENAIRHSPVCGKIRIQAVPEKVVPEAEPRIRITVSDEGSGVPPGEEMKIFERFYRVDRSRSRESGGAGLGLSIAKLLTEEAGGTIGVEPNPTGRGSQFWITLYQA